VILGIDPGLTGALALFEPSVAALHSIFDMPTQVLKRGAGMKREIDVQGLSKFLVAHQAVIHHAYFEWVGPMPKQGVSGVYQFGRGVGQLEGILATLVIPVTYLTPQKWQAKGRVRSGKDGSIKKAREVFPERAEWFTKNKHGRSDAALIAWVGSERLDT
jgi:crossover junction endodeoxyribonuclease RuvC